MIILELLKIINFKIIEISINISNSLKFTNQKYYLQTNYKLASNKMEHQNWDLSILRGKRFLF